MARYITVQKCPDDPDETPLFEQPGSESAVRESWSEPASQLGLPLIAAIYDHGFYQGVRWQCPQLVQILHELAQLEEYWQRAFPIDMFNELADRANFVRMAVALAQEHNATIDIG